MATRKKLVVLGTGFAALSVIRKIDVDFYEVTVVSPRNHFLFTPLLPSTTVGTVEFRSIIEPVRKVRAGVEFIQAECTGIDIEHRRVLVRQVEAEATIELSYDLLIIAVGARNNTFGIPGVEKHAHFLKELADARTIRESIILCLERAAFPGLEATERDRLLHFVIVGGGPTGVEFAAELHDLLTEDMKKSYPALAGRVRITLLEALRTILGGFDEQLRRYAIERFRRQEIELRLETPVARVGDGLLALKSGEEIPAGLIIWSTGNGPVQLLESLACTKERGRLLTDELLRLPEHPECYALGDCALVTGKQLPQTAQLAMQQGKYLARALNALARGASPRPFVFKDLGMLAYIGENRALADLTRASIGWKGRLAYLFWRSAYLTRLVSIKNKILVLFDWIKTALFGRDLSKF